MMTNSYTSFVNHSCVPNACWMKIGEDALFVRAARHLRKGEEVTTSYLLRLPTAPLPMRAAGLRTLGFKCSCPRCLFEESIERFTEMSTLPEWLYIIAHQISSYEAESFMECEMLQGICGKGIKKLEWGLKNLISLSDNEGKQQWMRCSFWAFYILDMLDCAFQRRSTLMRDMETLVRAVHHTMGASEDLLLLVRKLVRRGVIQSPPVEAILAPMSVCLYGKLPSSSLKKLNDLRISMEE
ncbi:hypothetical protein KP509_36G043500 [Ceratopteris richardii]|uniref:SET domain-containing protein n=1 Tax=Ceratopteris richardii TaxID=49495 RepID=A0A8T2QBG1_CERRI|nr:hypothetical protein KP509_36G043500 [Ceratopteris richardii]